MLVLFIGKEANAHISLGDHFFDLICYDFTPHPHSPILVPSFLPLSQDPDIARIDPGLIPIQPSDPLVSFSYVLPHLKGMVENLRVNEETTIVLDTPYNVRAVRGLYACDCVSFAVQSLFIPVNLLSSKSRNRRINLFVGA